MDEIGGADGRNEFSRAYLPRLRGFSRRILGSTARRADVDDLIHDSLAAVLGRMPDFRDPEALYKRISGQIRNELRRQRHQAERAPRFLDELDEDPACRPTCLRPPAETREELRLVLRGLPPQQRDVVLLHDVDGLPIREIADRLGIPMGTVKSRLSSGRSRAEGLCDVRGYFLEEDSGSGGTNSSVNSEME